jgi:tetratricopeptide (TPR) repeat protein
MQKQSLASYWHQLKSNPLDASTWQDLALIYAQCRLPWHTRYVAIQANRLQAEGRQAMEALLQQCQQQASAENSIFSRLSVDVLSRAEFSESAECLKSLTSLSESLSDDWLSLVYRFRLHDILPDDPAQAPSLERLTELEYLPGESAHLIGRAAMSPNPQFLALLAEHSFNHNYWAEAVALRRQIVQMTPEDASAWLALAQTESQINESGPALESCERALALKPDYAEAQLLQAQLQDKTGEGESYFRVVLAQYEKGDPLSRLSSSVAMSSLYAGFLTAEQRADLNPALKKWTDHCA